MYGRRKRRNQNNSTAIVCESWTFIQWLDKLSHHAKRNQRMNYLIASPTIHHVELTECKKIIDNWDSPGLFARRGGAVKAKISIPQEFVNLQICSQNPSWPQNIRYSDAVIQHLIEWPILPRKRQPRAAAPSPVRPSWKKRSLISTVYLANRGYTLVGLGTLLDEPIESARLSREQREWSGFETNIHISCLICRIF